MSKGSRPRPFSVDQKTFNDNFDRIFRKSTDHLAELEQLDKSLSTPEEDEALNELEARQRFINGGIAQLGEQ